MDNIQKFNEWCKTNNIDPDNFIETYKNREEKNRRKKDIERFESHKELIGKCYKEGSKYYKVVSIKAGNSCRVSCLIFDEHPNVDFKHNYQKVFWHSDYEGKFIFDCIDVDDVLVGTKYGTIIGLTDWKEISEGEYRYAYHRFCNELIDMKIED